MLPSARRPAALLRTDSRTGTPVSTALSDTARFADAGLFRALLALASRRHILPCASFLRNKWRPFAPPRVVRTRGPARDHHYYERLRLLPWPHGLPPSERLGRLLSQVYSPWQISPLTRTSLPDM